MGSDNIWAREGAMGGRGGRTEVTVSIIDQWGILDTLVKRIIIVPF